MNKTDMSSRIGSIFKALVARFLPFDSAIRRACLFDTYLKQVRFRGKNVILKRSVSFTKPYGLVLGHDIVIEGGGEIDATAGVLIGDRCYIDRNTNISSVAKGSGSDLFAPVIIGSGNEVKSDIAPGTILPNQVESKGLSKYSGQILFIVSTGRSGSKAIAKLLDQHPDAECYHDAFPHINPWSCDLLYKSDDASKLKGKLQTLYNSLDIGRNKVHGQSDQKLTPLIPVLSELFPESKFVWLIRKADSFVNTSYPRGWFDNSEFNFPPNPVEYFEKRLTPSEFDAAHRTNGFLVGEFSETDWKEMTAFERNCWYWAFWNQLIEDNLDQLDKDRWMMLRLDELSARTNQFLDFLLLPQVELQARRVNVATYKKITRDDWNSAMEAIYEKHCLQGMKKWFNG